MTVDEMVAMVINAVHNVHSDESTHARVTAAVLAIVKDEREKAAAMFDAAAADMADGQTLRTAISSARTIARMLRKWP